MSMTAKARRRTRSLVIVVLLLLLTATFAYPQYKEFSQRKRGTELKSVLLKVAQNQERRYLSVNEFSDSMIELGFPEDPYVTESGDWKISIDPGADANDFVARAVYIGRGANPFGDGCDWLSWSGGGLRKSGPNPNCW